MKRKEIETTDEVKPQQSLETILQLEIEMAEKIAASKEKADQKITNTQNSTTDRKTKIIEDARKERDRMVKEGIAKAEKEATERVANAKIESQKFVEVGKKFEKEAADNVLKLIFGTEDQEEK
jgi:tRNA uridine 5-carbamoylmethylation protein Kti12